MSVHTETPRPWRLHHAWRKGADAAAVALCREQLSGAGLSLQDSDDAGTADAAKMHGMELLAARAASSALLDLTELAGREGWPKRMPAGMQRYMTAGGRWHGIAMGIHRANCAWVNVALRDRIGLSEPIDMAGWLRWLDRARAITRYPLAVGGDAMQIGLLFESVLLAVAGAQTYRQLLMQAEPAAESWTGPAVLAALELLMALRGFVDRTQLVQTWQVQWELVRTGQAAMTVQGDWVRSSAGPTIAEWAAPGTRGRFIAIYDFFVPFSRAGSAASKRAASSLTEPVFQRSFAQLKGCMPALREAWSQVDPERARLLADEGAVVPSLTFDQCRPLPCKQVLLELVARHFIDSRSAQDCAQALARTDC